MLSIDRSLTHFASGVGHLESVVRNGGSSWHRSKNFSKRINLRDKLGSSNLRNVLRKCPVQDNSTKLVNIAKHVTVTEHTLIKTKEESECRRGDALFGTSV